MSAVSFIKSKQLWTGIIRYTLSMAMMSFGMLKILGMQFQTLYPISAWQQPLEHVAGTQLTWAFLGYSLWFQVLLGVFEFVPACLLLFRRTALLGAVLLLPMTLSVFLINHALHLWSNTRYLSLVLLLMNTTLLLAEWKWLRTILIDHFIQRSSNRKYVLPEIVVAILVVAIPVARRTMSDYDKKDKNVLNGDWFHNRPNEFTLISEKINDSMLPHHMVKSFFGQRDMYSELNDSVNNKDGYITYTIDESKHELNIIQTGYIVWKSTHYFITGNFRYETPGDSLLILHRKVSDSVDHTWTFRKRVMEINRTY